MCGLAGILSARDASDSPVSETVLRTMADTLVHRGPDADGVWIDSDHRIGLTHRRLAILDLSRTGAQPMISADSRYVVVFNGEIYNHLDLRNQLVASGEASQWRGHSDTETLLACFEVWGVKKTLHNVVGMFAITLWDRETRTLTLARDRMGEKPLYYGWCADSFVFGSELKALRKFPGFSNAISRDALTLYLRHSYIPAPYSVYEGIYKLEPGCLLTISPSAAGQAPASVPRAGESGDGWSLQRYWSLREQVMTGQSSRAGSEQQALASVESALKEAIRQQSIADVPLGAFLSGGIDSSLIVSLMQSQSSQPVKTFTIGFKEDGYNEAEYAKKIAAHLKTEHTELYLSSRQTMDVIPLLPELYDEPFADSSQIPTYLVAQMTREHVTVALSGDAGDELFGGYNRYSWAPGIWKKISLLPFGFRQKVLGVLISLSLKKVSSGDGFNGLIPPKWRVVLPAEKLQKLARRLESVKDIDDFYYSLVSEWRMPEDVVIGGKEPATLLNNRGGWPDLQQPEHRMMYLDAMTYLPDDILCKVDRAAMGVSLESRVPFLDHRVVETAWRLPLDMKIRNGQGKWPLRQILYKYVPRELVERPKQGFAIPLGDWLRGPLREWAESLLDPVRLKQEGYFHPEPIRKKWSEHLAGKFNWEHSLWSVLMFQAWLENQERLG